MTTTVHPLVQTLEDLYRSFGSGKALHDPERFEGAFKVVVHDWLRWQVLRELLPTVEFEALQTEADRRIADAIRTDTPEAA